MKRREFEEECLCDSAESLENFPWAVLSRKKPNCELLEQNKREFFVARNLDRDRQIKLRNGQRRRPQKH